MVERYGITFAAVCCACLIYGGIYELPHPSRFHAPVPPERIMEVTGTVVSNPIQSASGSTYRVYFSVSELCAAVPLTAAQNAAGASAQGVFSGGGQVQLQIPAQIVEANLPDGLYSRYSAAGEAGVQDFLIEAGTKLSAGVSVMDADSARPIFYVQPDTVTVLSYQPTLRNRCRLALRQILAAWGDAGALALALFSASTDTLNDSVQDAFRTAGLAHVLALSGMHLSLFAGITRAAAKHAGRCISAAAGIAAAAAFIWFAGNSPSLFRSLLCMIIMTVYSWAGREPPFINVLSAAFLLQTIIAPQDMMQLSCILSYTSLAGIAVCGQAVRNLLLRVRIPYSAAEQLGSSASAQTATAPVTLAVFGTAAPIGVAASIIVSPLTDLFMGLSLCCIAVSACVPALIPYAGIPVRCLYLLIARIVEWFALFPVVLLPQ